MKLKNPKKSRKEENRILLKANTCHTIISKRKTSGI
jgi:hypothetical protein